MHFAQLVAAISIGLFVAGCSDDGTPDNNAANNGNNGNNVDNTPLEERDAFVTFDLADGAAAGTTTPNLNDSYWVYDPMTAFTRIDFHGAFQAWDDVQVKINLPMAELGTYTDVPEDESEVADDLVIIFQKGDTEYVLVPHTWTAEIEAYEDATDTISGTFSGEFWEWDDAFYSDIVGVPPADRTEVTVSNGRFKVRWGARNGSMSEKWE